MGRLVLFFCIISQGWSGVGCEISMSVSPDVLSLMATPTSTATINSTQCIIIPTVQVIR